MPDFEKLGVFYLGREYDLATKQPRDDLLLYDSKDLVTHAVCVGMTGSGKTGLCLALLEEAAIDGIPVDRDRPEGRSRESAAHLPRSARARTSAPGSTTRTRAARASTPDDYAAQQADALERRPGGVGPGRRAHPAPARARPSSRSTRPAAAPASRSRSSTPSPRPRARSPTIAELLAERVSATVTGLLGLLGIDADPLQSREHILLSTLLQHRWRQARDLDLAQLIQAIQTAAVRSQIGVFDLESFYPGEGALRAGDALNNLLASPGFATWLEGEPLDIDRLLYTAEGKPRVAIFSIAHLSDAERMFFVTLLLTQLLGWMRTPARDDEPARALLHGRDLRLLPAGRQSAVEAADADARSSRRAPSGSASCSARRTRSISTTRASPTPAPGSSGGCRPSATRSACSTGSKALPPARAGASIARGWRRRSRVWDSGSSS